MQEHGDAVAIACGAGAHTYAELLQAAHCVASDLIGNRDDLAEQRVGIMARPGFDYTVALLGVWCAGGIAVPLCLEHPAGEFKYVLNDTAAACVLTSAAYTESVRDLKLEQPCRIRAISDALHTEVRSMPTLSADRRAMILYTSGTTSRPKGVVTTHGNITAQIESLIQAWTWSANDRILHFLPLHHIHGIINVLCCSLWAGACCETLPKFDADRAWHYIAEGDLTLFMAVPTIYVKLIAAWNESESEQQQRYSDAASALRLMVSGSAALPVTVLERWEAITGQRLLERYGMTEIGMGLSNPLVGERRAGFVGAPLPGVEVMLADEHGGRIDNEGLQGEICVRGGTVFNEYWENEAATRNAFRDGWFLTGDIAIVEDGAYKILGRNSVDIIKSGGYKISALEIEEVLRMHPDIQECAVVGVPDEEWGERVSAAIVTSPGRTIELADLRAWATDKLAKYKLPSRLMAMDELPRNVMGKVTKPAIQALFK